MEMLTCSVQDPFYEPYDAEVHIATAHLYLQFIGYLIEAEEVCALTNFRGAEQGVSYCTVCCVLLAVCFHARSNEKKKCLEGPRRCSVSCCRHSYLKKKELYLTNDEGHLEISMVPCTPQGVVLKDEDDELFVEDPHELLGKRVDYLLRVRKGSGRGANNKVFPKLFFFLDEHVVCSFVCTPGSQLLLLPCIAWKVMLL